MKIRNGLIVVLVTALLAGCSINPKPQTQILSAGTVKMDGQWIVALGTTKLGPKHLAPPNTKDRAYAEQLPQDVVQQCIAFLDKGSPIKSTLSTARRVDSYILVALSYKDGPSPSDRFVVYSTNEKKVIGEFVWYIQK